jgi:hypothetical protein
MQQPPYEVNHNNVIETIVTYDSRQKPLCVDDTLKFNS